MAPTVLMNRRREITPLGPRLRGSGAMTALPVRKLIYDVLYDVPACMCLSAERPALSRALLRVGSSAGLNEALRAAYDPP